MLTYDADDEEGGIHGSSGGHSRQTGLVGEGHRPVRRELAKRGGSKQDDVYTIRMRSTVSSAAFSAALEREREIRGPGPLMHTTSSSLR
jgi:hypothetical protein